jgi:hypothetical protein
MPIAVDSNGNAWVGNAFTTSPNSYPTAIMIQDTDRTECSPDPSTYSANSVPLEWSFWNGTR